MQFLVCVCVSSNFYDVSLLMSLLLVLLKLQMEKCNPGLAVNVYGYEEKKVHLLRLSKTPQTAINLMLLYDAERDTSHWVWIKNFSRLCAYLTKHNGRQHYCFRCVSGHHTLAQLNKHLTYCNDHKATTAILPSKRYMLADGIYTLPYGHKDI